MANCWLCSIFEFIALCILRLRLCLLLVMQVSQRRAYVYSNVIIRKLYRSDFNEVFRQGREECTQASVGSAAACLSEAGVHLTS